MTIITAAPASGAFGQALRRLRTSRRLSQARLANAARIDHSTVNRLEAGQRNPSRAMVLALCAALDATPDETARLLGAAGFASDAPIADPLVAELDAMLRDATLPEMARHYLRASVESAMWLARTRAAQIAEAA